MDKHRNILEICKDYNIILNSQYKAVCPFHNEKEPSLTIYPTTNSFYCFGCKEGGDDIELLSLLTGKSPGEILRDRNKNLSFEEKRQILKRQKERERLNAFKDWINNALGVLLDTYKYLYHSEFSWLKVKNLAYIDYLILKIENDPSSFYEEYRGLIEVLSERRFTEQNEYQIST